MRIGKGTYAEVFRTGNIAVKRINCGRDTLRTVKFEILSHILFFSPFVPRCISYNDTEINMSCAANPLSHYYGNGHQFMLQEKTHITLSLLNALNIMHKHQITHNDLRADNVLYFPNSSIKWKLADFTCIAKADQYYPDIYNALVYCPPESLSKRYISNKSDVWMLGCLLHSIQINRYDIFNLHSPGIRVDKEGNETVIDPDDLTHDDFVKKLEKIYALGQEEFDRNLNPISPDRYMLKLDIDQRFSVDDVLNRYNQLPHQYDNSVTPPPGYNVDVVLNAARDDGISVEQFDNGMRGYQTEGIKQIDYTANNIVGHIFSTSISDKFDYNQSIPFADKYY